jgi:5-methylcytosine-specific restriction endonuclease McrA
MVFLYTGQGVDCFEKKVAAGKRRRALRERAVAYLGGSCRICGYDKCLSAFDFHHINALEKDFTISARMTSWAAIEHELQKCVLLCARCHREVHDGLHPRYLEDDSTMRGSYGDLDEDELPGMPDELQVASA